MRPQRRMHEILVCAVVLLQLSSTTLGIDIALTMPSKYCVMERVKRMLAYNCNDLRLKEVPQYMKSGVELIELSENRIRDLTVDSFSKYSDLRYLYMYENMIQSVEPGTFAQLTYLEVLGLSGNALTTLPAELFHMRELRTLYAADNNLFDLKVDLEDIRKPMTAPLQIISLASCKLQSIPDFGLMPNLLHANFSMNPMTQLENEQLAPMCNLKTIDLSGTQMSGCVCQQTRAYLASASVYIKNGPNYCDNTGTSGCSLDPPSNATQQLYASCIASKAAQVQEERQSSIMIYAAIASGCLAALVMLICCCIRNRKIERRKREEKKKAAARRKARKMKEALEQRLIGDEKSSPHNTSPVDSDCEKMAVVIRGSSGENNVIQVDIEKTPRGQ